MVADPGGQKRISVQQESSLGDAIGLIVELFRHHLIEILQLLMLQNLRMQSCHTVYRITGDDGEMCHFHLAVINDGHFRDLLLVAGILSRHLFQESPVDLFHDLVNSGKKTGEQLDGPLFQSLCHNGMVGISAGLGGYLPGLLPGQIIIIHQNAHQFRNRYRRMGIVELEGHFLMELPDIRVLPHIFCNRSLYGCGNEEILLFQAQLLTRIMVIVGVQNLHDISRQIFLLHRLLIIPLVKGIQLEAFHGFRIPDAQGVHDAISISDNRHIIGNRLYGLIPLLLKAVTAVFIHIHVYIAAELHFLGIFRAAQLKGISIRKPVVRNLHLITVADLLLEHTVTVTNAAAISGIPQSCKGIQEAGCQTSQSAVSQSRIRLLILNYINVNAQLFQRLSDLIISLQIDQVISQRASHQEFHGQIINRLGIFFLIFLLSRHPVINDHILNRVSDRLKNLLIRRLFKSFTIKRLNIGKYASLEKLLVKILNCRFL